MVRSAPRWNFTHWLPTYSCDSDCPFSFLHSCRYGYDYLCQNPPYGGEMHPEDDICYLSAVPFEGAPCSDAAGAQKGYMDIMQRELEELG